MIGWREWVSMPELGLQYIKAKIDTGARTSALHAFAVDKINVKGAERVHFDIHPLQYNTKKVISCIADIHDVRMVSDSGGHREQRFVIKTPVVMGDDQWDIEITLTNRDTMAFRMLLGRTALKGRYTVNPNRSFLVSHRG